MEKYTIGIDYGSDSVRSLIVNATNGEELASKVFQYPRWTQGSYCDPGKKQFRQHPLDYLEGLAYTIKEALQEVSDEVRENIVGISIDTTGSTIVPVNKEGSPLSLLPAFAENPNAMFVLWKDHTAIHEADEINLLAKNWGGEDFTKYEGGIYSSEWFWAKMLHILRIDPKVREAAYSWVEHCDWIPAVLTGNTDPLALKRSRCAAGHKAMWHASWGGLPPTEFLSKLDPLLSEVRDRLYDETYTCDESVGTLSKEWAEKLGLSTKVVVGVGAYDAHLGAVGAHIKPYYLSKVMGTSTCDMLIAPMQDVQDKLIRGICGQVDGSIIPGMMGMEAGQSAFGDIYAWFRNLLAWPIKELDKSPHIPEENRKKIKEELINNILIKLSSEAEKIPTEENAVLALDWMNGRRTPDANQNLQGVITGLSLGTDAPHIFKALVEATAFGAKAIVDRFTEEGIEIKGIIALGGVAKKSDYVMQTVCDTLNMPIEVVKSEQACALGAAMAAATASGLYATIEEAQKAMNSGFEKTYNPKPEKVKILHKSYLRYKELGKFAEKFVNNN